VKILCFQADSRKAGGAYRTVTGRVKKLDDHERNLLLEDGTIISLEQIFDIEVE
jgi:hypothetical protein